MPNVSVKINEMFEGTAYAEQVERVANADADAVGFWPWYGDDVEAVARAASRHDLELAYLSGGSESVDGPEFPLTDPDRKEESITEIRRMISLAADLDAHAVNVIPGRERPRVDPAVKRRTVVDVLRAVSPTAEEAGVQVLVEPLNTRVDHPDHYLSSSREGYAIVRAVDSPNVTLLYDIYHQQIMEGNIIESISTLADEIGHIHIADVPGRHEPGTGELAYQRIFDAVFETGYDGYIECEFVPLGDPESVIERVVSMVAESD